MHFRDEGCDDRTGNVFFSSHFQTFYFGNIKTYITYIIYVICIYIQNHFMSLQAHPHAYYENQNILQGYEFDSIMFERVILAFIELNGEVARGQSHNLNLKLSTLASFGISFIFVSSLQVTLYLTHLRYPQDVTSSRSENTEPVSTVLSLKFQLCHPFKPLPPFSLSNS